MDKQRLSKVICFIALVISVFFGSFSVAFADDSDSVGLQEGDIVGGVEFTDASQTFDLSLAAELGPYDYVGATSIHTQKSYAWLKWSNYTGNTISAWHGAYTFDASIPVLFRLDVERGHTYSGQIEFMLHMEFPDINTLNDHQYQYMRVSLSDFEQQSKFEGITVSYWGFTNFSSYSTSGTCDVTVCINFDNYQPTFTDTLNINSMFNLTGHIVCLDTVPNTNTANVFPVINCSVSTDWAGELYDYPTDAIVDSDGSLIKNQTEQQAQISLQEMQQQSQISQQEMQQQQQIADQQAQQSAQQHDDLVNGYDNAANDNMLADKNSVLQGFEQQQDQAISNGQQYIADFSANYDTAPLQAMAPAFMMISTWFNSLWGGMGNFSSVLIVGLMLCVAGYVLKLKH